MRTASDKSRFEQLMASAREKAAKDKEEGGDKKEELPQPPKRLLHNHGHPWDHITGD